MIKTMVIDSDNDDIEELDDEYNLGASLTAVTKINAPVFDVTFRLLGKSHHLVRILRQNHGSALNKDKCKKVKAR